MFKFNFNKSSTTTIIPPISVSKRTIDYLPVNKKCINHNLNINDLTDIVVELDNEIENLKIIKTKIEEILSNKRKTEIKKDDISKIYDNCLSVEHPIEILTKKIKEDNPIQKNIVNEQMDKSKDIQKDNENKEIVDNMNDQIDIGKNIDKINI